MRIPENLKESKAPAAVRLVAILDFIAEKGSASFSEISTQLAIPKSSTHHLLEVLCATQMLRLRVDGRYALGLHLFELGGLAASGLDIRLEAIPYLHELVELTGLTCHQGIMEGDEAFFLSKIQSPQAIILTSWEGKRIRLHSTSLGKILLAWRQTEQVEQILAKATFVKKTETTITDKQRFIEHLALVKQQGWAYDDGENINEIRCISAPVFDTKGDVLCAIGLTGMVSQFTNGKKEEYLSHLLATTEKISNAVNFGLKSRPMNKQ
ncbi:IclR family transcriptional regulator [Cedecea sp.]|uniref:IclR family transcriptional regulator n=1 Tax=Cedecea sp. TaxID=1970739 RepID=UPI0012ADAD99|nr:helix-turn-helix domain-containing protein [Enterobacteriaceae bacterium RIT693]